MNTNQSIASLSTKYQYGILSLPFVIDYINENFASRQIKSISPHSFTIGSNHNGENIGYNIEQHNCLFFGELHLSINPNENALQDETIKIRYRSWFNTQPYYKHIQRVVEQENYINEQTVSHELFDHLTLAQGSLKYDVYLTFIGFKIDIS